MAMKISGSKFDRRAARIERRLQLVGDWKPREASGAEHAVFDRSFAVAEAARGLEEVAGSARSTGSAAASMGCLTSGFESLANAMLAMRGVVLREMSDCPSDAEGPGNVEQLGRLLFAIDQNMRFAAHAADLARQAAAESLEDAATAPAG